MHITDLRKKENPEKFIDLDPGWIIKKNKHCYLLCFSISLIVYNSQIHIGMVTQFFLMATILKLSLEPCCPFVPPALLGQLSVLTLSSPELSWALLSSPGLPVISSFLSIAFSDDFGFTTFCQNTLLSKDNCYTHRAFYNPLLKEEGLTCRLVD